jgi:hypothetical protein
MIVGCLRHATEGSVLRVSSSLIEDLVRQCENVVLPCPPSELLELPSLAVALDAVPDPRRRQGRRYRLGFLFALAVAAVLGGAKSLSAIAQWARDADEAVLTALGAPARTCPAATTIGRAFERVDPDALDDACFGWINTLRAHATYLRKRKAFYVFYAMGNQPTLFETLDELDWKTVPIGHTDEKVAHGRHEQRTVQVRPAPKGLRFPHAAQVFLIERKISHPKTGKRISSVAVLGVTSLTADHATPAELAALVCGQWTIDAAPHGEKGAILRPSGCITPTSSTPRIHPGSVLTVR